MASRSPLIPEEGEGPELAVTLDLTISATALDSFRAAIEELAGPA